MDFNEIMTGNKEGTRAFSYENIINTCNSIMKDTSYIDLSDIITGCKMLAVSFILVNVIVRYLGGRKDDSFESTKKIPLTPLYLMGQAGFLILVWNFSTISMYLDEILAAVCQSIESGLDNKAGSLYNVAQTALLSGVAEENIASEESDIAIDTLSILSNIANPFYWITTLAQWIGWLVNTFVLGFMLIERTVLLILLNILSPFVIALSVIEKFRDMFLKWIKIYIAVFLIMPCLLIIGTLCTLFYTHLSESCDSIGLVTDEMAIVICLVVLVKARLYKASVSLLYKIFGV